MGGLWGTLLVPGEPTHPGTGLSSLPSVSFQDKKEDRATIVLGLTLRGMQVYQVPGAPPNPPPAGLVLLPLG